MREGGSSGVDAEPWQAAYEEAKRAAFDALSCAANDAAAARDVAIKHLYFGKCCIVNTRYINL
jgi:hypothetical protein